MLLLRKEGEKKHRANTSFSQLNHSPRTTTRIYEDGGCFQFFAHARRMLVEREKEK